MCTPIIRMIFTVLGTHLTTKHKGKMIDNHNEGIEHGNQIKAIEKQLEIGPQVADQQHKRWTNQLYERTPSDVCVSMEYPHIVRVIAQRIDCSDK